MDKQEISQLIKQRGFHKAGITRIENFISTFNNEINSIRDIKIRLEMLEKNWEKYVETQMLLETNDTATDHQDDIVQVEEQYCKTRAAMETLLNVESKFMNERGKVEGNVITNCHQIQLPAINLPPFSGDFTQWIHFRDIFESLVIKNQALSDVQRLHYLNSSLCSEAKDLISNIPICADNFCAAWDLVYKRYNNPRLIVQRHITNLLNLPSSTKESATNLRHLINHVKGNISAVNAIKELSVPLHELMLSQMILNNIDLSSRKAWEHRASCSELPTLADLLLFLEERCQALETLQVTRTEVGSQQLKQEGKYGKKSYLITQVLCKICNKSHKISKCPEFLKLNLNQRQAMIRKYQLCYNCLGTNHMSPKCDSKHNCHTCGLRHHTLIHKHINNSQQDVNTNDQPTKEPSNNYCSIRHTSSEVLLATAIVEVRDHIGQIHECRALLDSASQSNFITETLVHRLHLQRHKNNIQIHGLNNIKADTDHCVTLHIQSRYHSYNRTISCSVLKKITNSAPNTFIDIHDWKLPTNINLADPSFNVPGSIDLLIGAELYFNLLRPCEQIVIPGYPTLVSTQLGWIVSGVVPTSIIGLKTSSQLVGNFLVRNDVLQDQLQRFWEVEEITNAVSNVNKGFCEDHFRNNTTRDKSGRYIVRLPLTNNPSILGDSLHGATTRFLKLERRLSYNEGLRHDYAEFLREYELLGHMERVKDTERDNVLSYYLPHHPVLKASSSTTKLRVVFDASFKSSSGYSLNDILDIGPTIQQDLCSIVLRCRTHKVCFTADIAKMYRQILVHEDDCHLQRILWRASSDEPLQVYKLKTVTYGTSAAPFLAIRCLHQLAEDKGDSFPLGAQVLIRDMYVDDCISGAPTIEEAIEIQNQLIKLLKEGGFHLRKWCSNHPGILENVPEEDRETQLPLRFNDEESVKTLGLSWHPASDKFQISVKIRELKVCTKRSILSTIAAIFDPLGFITPVTIRFKIFMQRLWQAKLDWDDELSLELQQRWKVLIQQLSSINTIRVDRLVTLSSPLKVQLHGFADASEQAYGACMYIRSFDASGNITVRLLCAKSRVAPLKRISIPRLELCAALILARLLKSVQGSLNICIDQLWLWSDSTIVLTWISSPSCQWKTFVANRVTEIQEATKGAVWCHVASQDNPADLISRGVPPYQLEKTELWWNGPNWLHTDIMEFSKSHETSILSEVPEKRSVKSLLVTQESDWEILHKFSKLYHLERVIAYCLRFIGNSRTKVKIIHPLSSQEVKFALKKIIKHIQQRHFSSEISALTSGTSIPRGSELRSFTPFLDNENLLRVGGRLHESPLAYNTKFPLILPRQHYVTYLIVVAEHERLLHANQQLVITSLRKQYCIPKIRQLVKKVVHKCLTCFRFRATGAQQQMGTLPRHRVQPARAFLNSGVDYAGPVLLRIGGPRSKSTIKAYIAIFVCLSTKAIHIELVTGLTSEAFIAAFRRFISRRGRCCNLYSDNGTSFVGANNQLRELGRFLRSKDVQNELYSFAAAEDFTWHFIPPNAPHFGGLWEAAVKSMKYHLRRAAGNRSFTYEQMATILCQIEACLNSRPLAPMSLDDPNEFSILTPGHFLIGEALTNLPEPDLTDVPLCKLDRWQQLQQMTQTLWRRWSTDYLHGLQQRTKWISKTENLRPNQLVLVKEATPPLQWRTAIIKEVHPGPDGLVRVVTLRTPTGEIKRSIQKLCPFPE